MNVVRLLCIVYSIHCFAIQAGEEVFLDPNESALSKQSCIQVLAAQKFKHGDLGQLPRDIVHLILDHLDLYWQGHFQRSKFEVCPQLKNTDISQIPDEDKEEYLRLSRKKLHFNQRVAKLKRQENLRRLRLAQKSLAKD